MKKKNKQVVLFSEVGIKPEITKNNPGLWFVMVCARQPTMSVVVCHSSHGLTCDWFGLSWLLQH